MSQRRVTLLECDACHRQVNLEAMAGDEDEDGWRRLRSPFPRIEEHAKSEWFFDVCSRHCAEVLLGSWLDNVYDPAAVSSLR